MFDDFLGGTLLGERSLDDYYIVYKQCLLNHIRYDAILDCYPIFGIFLDYILHCAISDDHMLYDHSVSNDILQAYTLRRALFYTIAPWTSPATIMLS